MVEVLFIYDGKSIIIQCSIEDKVKDIINHFKNKIKEENNDLCYIYNGDKINEELTLSQIVVDKNENKINILVYNNKIDKDEKEIISNEIICPVCKENILINIKDYKINLYECKNGHKIENISLNEYENIQKIDLSKIICNECCKYNKNDIYDNKFYICNECKINLCPLCKSKHDNNHNIINYNDKNYICKKHNDKYIKYCKECKENICFLCINEHNNHNIIDLLNIIPNKDELLKEMKNFSEIFNKFKDNIKEINNILNKVLNNIEIYYKIFNNIINNYNNNNRNYENYTNLNEIKSSNINIINDLNNIINENNINNKFKNIIDIYNKIIKINKNKIYENGDKYIGEFINNLKNGKGILYYNKNNKFERNRYEGDFKDDKLEGKGILYWNDGDRYEGDYKDEKREGKGIYYWTDGDKYQGDYKDDKIEGKGIYYYNNGNKYKGDFKDGKKEGKGTYYWNDGDRYEGDWKDNKIEGKGIFYYNNGDREMGDYLNGKQIGIHVKLNYNGKVTQQKY